MHPLLQPAAQVRGACSVLLGFDLQGHQQWRSTMISRKISRRAFLSTGSVAIAATATPNWLEALTSRRRSANHCIMLLLVGGPSHLDTWDMKPDAISSVRGPFRPISSNVSGIQVSEIFPRMAKLADKFALVRSVHSRTRALHNLGCQEIQTGRVVRGMEFPHCGSIVSRFRHRNGMPGHVVLSSSVPDTDASLLLGQSAGFMGKKYAPRIIPDLSPRRLTHVGEVPGEPRTRCFGQALDLEREPLRIRERYGHHEFGRACLLARRLVERGVTFVTVNMVGSESGVDSWDIHGSLPFSKIGCYRDRIGPMFDNAYSALLEDLHSRGLLANTLVLAVGEFGRTPRLNSGGGRDHWTGCWTAVFAGGGVRGGQVIGSSDAIGAEPRDRPVGPAQIVATVYHALGVPAGVCLSAPSGELVGIVEAGIEPIYELF